MSCNNNNSVTGANRLSTRVDNFVLKQSSAPVDFPATTELLESVTVPEDQNSLNNASYTDKHITEVRSDFGDTVSALVTTIAETYATKDLAYGKYTLQVSAEAGGNLVTTGMEFTSLSGATESYSGVKFNADNFEIWDGTNSHQLFSLNADNNKLTLNTNVEINGNLVVDGTITGGSGTGAKIAGSTITDANIASLNAGKITAGSINASLINVYNLNGGNINAGKVAAAYIDVVGVLTVGDGIRITKDTTYSSQTYGMVNHKGAYIEDSTKSQTLTVYNKSSTSGYAGYFRNNSASSGSIGIAGYSQAATNSIGVLGQGLGYGVKGIGNQYGVYASGTAYYDFYSAHGTYGTAGTEHKFTGNVEVTGTLKLTTSGTVYNVGVKTDGTLYLIGY